MIRPPHRRPLFTLLLLALCLALPACEPDEAPEGLSVTLADERFDLELAHTPDAQATGLMHRDHLGPNEGMLFAFPHSQVRQFWMKNCLISLDVIFLDARGRIVAIHTMPAPDPATSDAQLPRYSSHWPAQFAIELAAGRAWELGLAEGQKIDLPLDWLKRLAR